MNASKSKQAQPHVSVLRDETIRLLNVKPGGRYIDGTLGAGGHAAAILEESMTAELLGIDRDESALIHAAERLEADERRVHLERGTFDQMAMLAESIGWSSVDGILLDIGVSSMQIDQADRGFSYRQDGPLDMRMDRRSPMTASNLLNSAERGELIRIFREYGEEPRARRLAEAIIERREEQPWERTAELSQLVQDVLGRKGKRSHPIESRIFQAIRIAVNDELGMLQRALDQALPLLAPEGRLVVITFHSLEDRMVKQRMRDWALDCICPPGLPVCACDKKQEVKVLTRKPITASEDELALNPRAASAKLRCCEKLIPEN